MSGFHLRGTGLGIKWMREHVAHEGDECLIWPIGRYANGYGAMSLDGVSYYAHRYMCELAHGPAPTGHEAAHSCGNGHGGCVNPQHLSWKTPSENQRDRNAHGTNGKRPSWRLTREQRDEIAALKGTITQREIAARYGVSFQTISHLHRHVVKENVFYAWEDKFLRDNRQAMKVRAIAKELNRTERSVTQRLNRLGITKANIR